MVDISISEKQGLKVELIGATKRIYNCSYELIAEDGIDPCLNKISSTVDYKDSSKVMMAATNILSDALIRLLTKLSYLVIEGKLKSITEEKGIIDIISELDYKQNAFLVEFIRDIRSIDIIVTEDGELAISAVDKHSYNVCTLEYEVVKNKSNPDLFLTSAEIVSSEESANTFTEILENIMDNYLPVFNRMLQLMTAKETELNFIDEESSDVSEILKDRVLSTTDFMNNKATMEDLYNRHDTYLYELKTTKNKKAVGLYISSPTGIIVCSKDCDSFYEESIWGTLEEEEIEEVLCALS